MANPALPSEQERMLAFLVVMEFIETKREYIDSHPISDEDPEACIQRLLDICELNMAIEQAEVLYDSIVVNPSSQ